MTTLAPLPFLVRSFWTPARRHSAGMAFMLAALLLLPEVAFASTYAGQALLEWARGMIIAPLCLLSIVVSIAIAVFRPDFVKAAVWVTVVSLFLFFVISNATTIIGYLQS